MHRECLGHYKKDGASREWNNGWLEHVYNWEGKAPMAIACVSVYLCNWYYFWPMENMMHLGIFHEKTLDTMREFNCYSRKHNLLEIPVCKYNPVQGSIRIEVNPTIEIKS